MKEIQGSLAQLLCAILSQCNPSGFANGAAIQELICSYCRHNEEELPSALRRMQTLCQGEAYTIEVIDLVREARGLKIDLSEAA